MGPAFRRGARLHYPHLRFRTPDRLPTGIHRRTFLPSRGSRRFRFRLCRRHRQMIVLGARDEILQCSLSRAAATAGRCVAP